MTAPSQAVERSLPHDMIAWKAAAEIAQEQCVALTARVRDLEAALTDAREYLLNCSPRASDPSGKEWGRIMDASRAVLWGTR